LAAGRRQALAAVAVAGALVAGGAALADAATRGEPKITPTPTATPSAPSRQAPYQGHRGNCPHTGGGGGRSGATSL
jgi:hypothetical protein